MNDKLDNQTSLHQADNAYHHNIYTTLAHIRAQMAISAREAKRLINEIDLIAVSKTFDQQDIRPALLEGQRKFGENRVQEAHAKWPQLRKEFSNIELHLIGPLQSNKAAEAVSLFDVIESVDREKIALALSTEMAKQSRNLPCYIQVNTGLEPQKAGIAPQDSLNFIKHCQNVHGLNIVGLMCIPPADENPGPHFALLAKLAKQAKLTKLSMGMSDDYEIAIQFGATNIRVGSAIFGYRPAKLTKNPIEE